MRSLNEYLTTDERSAINERSVNYTKPRSVKVLQKIIKQRIAEQGPNCDLNDIDVSGMKSMSHLFCGDTDGVDKVLNSFNGDISQWDVSNVKDMGWMFCKSQFNGDISKWDVSKVENMENMFSSSKFNGDISRWKVSSKSGPWSMNGMIGKSPLEGNEPSWYKAS